MDRLGKILIAVDESAASLGAVEYVGRLMGGRPDVTVRLMHVLPPMPPGLREFGGSENPEEEARLSEALHQSQAQWVAQARQSAAGSMDKSVTLLIDHGFHGHQISADVAPALRDSGDIVARILERAEAWNCGTIVVGRRTLPWLRELFARHVGEELVRHADRYAVWVVETESAK